MSAVDWTTANQRVLAAEFARIRALLAGDDPQTAAAKLEAARAQLASKAAIDVIVESFDLTEFEREVLLLCAGVEMDAAVAAACPPSADWIGLPRVTFSLALARLSKPHWSALAPVAALRKWRLVELQEQGSTAHSRLAIDERLLHYLAGIDYVDPRVQAFMCARGAPGQLSPDQEPAVESIIGKLDHRTARAVVHLFGTDEASQAEIARRVASNYNLRLHRLDARDIPADQRDAELLATLWNRESRLLGSAMLVCTEESHGLVTAKFIERALGLVFVSSREHVPAVTADARAQVDKPDSDGRRHLWSVNLRDSAASLNGSLDEVSAHFELGSAEIVRAAEELCRGDLRGEVLATELWRTCRASSRRPLDDLAQRIEPRAGWQDLVLPEPQLCTLREVAAQVRHRFRVYERWGFGARSSRGLGISALFSGESGTGKTMAAEVLANELRLDLYRIDLASVVSKYIGETEKNLRRVFDAAENSGAILLFDEADALFGKRGEVKDGRDRFANIEISYLLQRMEAYRGLAILTTNIKSALDSAFNRRLRFVLQFPFPDATLRERIWRGAFPAATPLTDISYARLAQLSVAGGDIRNIAVNAAFLAAANHQRVGMDHLLSAARKDAAKRERPFSEAEFRGWA
jgi:hypothetical protein